MERWESRDRKATERVYTGGKDTGRVYDGLFIAVLDLISRQTVVKDAMKKLLYADDLALVANG